MKKDFTNVLHHRALSDGLALPRPKSRRVSPLCQELLHGQFSTMAASGSDTPNRLGPFRDLKRVGDPRAQIQSSAECIARITPPAGPISHTNNSRVGTPVLRHSAPQPQQRTFRAINWVPLGPPYFRDRFERCLAFLARLALVIRSLRRIGADD
jgi:hypothetical protein